MPGDRDALALPRDGRSRELNERQFVRGAPRRPVRRRRTGAEPHRRCRRVRELAHPGSTTGYGDTDLAGSLLQGREFALTGLQMRSNADDSFGDLSSETDDLDPFCPEESVRSPLRWIATLRGGVARQLGRVTVIASAMRQRRARLSSTIRIVSRSAVRPRCSCGRGAGRCCRWSRGQPRSRG